MNSYIELYLGDTDTKRELYPNNRVELTLCVGTFDEIIESLVKPALLAAGFSEGSVNRLEVTSDEI